MLQVQEPSSCRAEIQSHLLRGLQVKVCKCKKPFSSDCQTWCTRADCGGLSLFRHPVLRYYHKSERAKEPPKVWGGTDTLKYPNPVPYLLLLTLHPDVLHPDSSSSYSSANRLRALLVVPSSPFPSPVRRSSLFRRPLRRSRSPRGFASRIPAPHPSPLHFPETLDGVFGQAHVALCSPENGHECAFASLTDLDYGQAGVLSETRPQGNGSVQVRKTGRSSQGRGVQYQNVPQARGQVAQDKAGCCFLSNP